MDAEVTACWFRGRPLLRGERVNRAPHARIAVHSDCLRRDAVNEGDRPGLVATIAEVDLPSP